jgi:hypothetical protein
MAENPLAEELRVSAARFAQSGLRAFLQNDLPVFMLHAATALEHLAKAFLASIHGSLVAASDFDSVLHSCGQSRHARKPRSRMKTISAQEAVDRAGQLIPAIENLKRSLQLLILVRNGVVHAGRVEPDVETSVLVPFLRACDHLVAAIPEADRGQFWAGSLEAVDARLSRSSDVAKVRAADAVTAARTVFTERYSSMEPSLHEAVISSIEGSYDVERYEETLVACPACEHLALAQGSYDVDWEADWDYADGEAYIAGAYPVVNFSPGTIQCRVCALTLDGEEELRAAGVPTSWQLDSEDVDPGDFYEQEYE